MYLLQPELNIKKILIVDWDVHHGNGIQKMFWKDPRVLYFSIHRYFSVLIYFTVCSSIYRLVCLLLVDVLVWLIFHVCRFDFGTFYPTGDDGAYFMIGEDSGAGYNINVPWEHGGCGDADYLAVWEHILIPVAREFGPDIVLISGGFDAG